MFSAYQKTYRLPVDHMKKNIYEPMVLFIFSAYVIGVLSFGRVFTLLNFQCSALPIYVTEIVLIICIPFLLMHLKELQVWPRKFLLLLSAFFLMGCGYLIWAIAQKNFIAVRDVVLSAY